MLVLQIIAILFNTSADIELYKSYYNGEVVKHGKKGSSMTELRERLKMCKEFQPLPTVDTLVSWLDETVKDRLQVSSPPNTPISCYLSAAFLAPRALALS